MRTVIVHRSPDTGYERGLEARFAMARAINGITSVVVGLIVIGILLVVLDANRSNDIVAAVLDAARWLVTPFRDLFSLHGDWRIIVNWGLAAVVYSMIGGFLARLALR